QGAKIGSSLREQWVPCLTSLILLCNPNEKPLLSVCKIRKIAVALLATLSAGCVAATRYEVTFSEESTLATIDRSWSVSQPARYRPANWSYLWQADNTYPAD